MSFRLFFSGAEHPSWRKRLLAHGVDRVAINFTDMLPRLPKKKAWPKVSDLFPDEVDVALYWAPRSGWTDAEIDAFTESYQLFAEENRLRLSLAVAVYDTPEWAIPLWDGGERAEHVLPYAEDHLVAVTGKHLEDRKARSFMASVRAMKGGLVGVGVSDPKLLPGLVAATSSSWMSATRYGETVLWDGARLRRFPASRKDEVRRRYRTVIEKAGLDPTLVIEDDKDAVVALTLWSWRQMEAHMVKRRVRPVPPEEDGDDGVVVDLVARSALQPPEEFPAGEVERVARSPKEGGNVEQVIDRERTPLPVLQMLVEEVTEGDETKTVTKPMVSDRTLRKCDSCVIADRCPGFQPHHSCAYSIPIEIRTKDQLQGILTGLLEIQSQRVLFTRMAEELEGGYPDPNLSAELDRFMGMVKDFKEISDNRDFINIKVESRGQAGILSRVFGAHVGEEARALPSGGAGESGTDEFLKESLGIVDGEVVDD